MCNNQRQIMKKAKGTSIAGGHVDYDPKQIANIIKRYQELRSAIEITSARYEQTNGGGSRTGKEEILCALADVDRAMNQLSPRQRVVIRMLEEGYPCEEICSRLGIRLATVKFHVSQGIYRLTAYLNLH